jgi:hypothetical protein
MLDRILLLAFVKRNKYDTPEFVFFEAYRSGIRFVL